MSHLPDVPCCMESVRHLIHARLYSPDAHQGNCLRQYATQAMGMSSEFLTNALAQLAAKSTLVRLVAKGFCYNIQ